VVGDAFFRADADGNSIIQMADAFFTLRALHLPDSPQPPCMDAADADDNGAMEMADAIYTLGYLYVPGAPPPPAPGPDNCAVDPTPDDMDCTAHPCVGSPARGE
jgi:hypothetical protein